MRIRTSALTVSALVVSSFCSAGADGATEFSSYIQKVQRALSIVQQAKDYRSFDDDQAAKVRQLLPESEQVVLHGQVYNVNHQWLRTSIEIAGRGKGQGERDQAFRTLLGSLFTLNEELQAAGQQGAVPDTNSLNRLSEILSRREFQVKKGQTLLERLLEKLVEILSSIFRFLPKRGTTSERVLKVVILGVSGGALLYLLRTVGRSLKRSRAVKRKTDRVVLGKEIEESTSANDLVDQALVLRATGEYRNGIRKLYAAVLVRLDEMRLIKIARSTTNREYLRALRGAAPSLGDLFQSLTDSFEFFWYGKGETRAEDFEKFYAGSKEVVDLQQPAAA